MDILLHDLEIKNETKENHLAAMRKRISTR